MEYNGRKVLFSTWHGSHLYGLSHTNSDEDFYTVVETVQNSQRKYSRQSINDGVDSMVVDFGTWLRQCDDGVPQALEAMFSQMALHDDLAAFRAGYRVTTSAYSRYLRTITNFVYSQDYKRKRHGLRLALNMYDFSRTGRFNPTLSENEQDFVSEVAYKDTDVVYAYAFNIALDRLPPRLLV